MINRRVAMDHPGRVSALAVLNSPHERSPQAQALVEARARDTGAGGPAANLDETLARWFTDAFRRDHPDAVAMVRDVVLANDPGNYAAHRQVLASGVIELIRPAPPIAHPTLVMTCENDSGSTPAMSHAIAAEIPGAETIIVPGLQHLGLIEQPRLFADPLHDFLTRTLITGQTT
jgi:pimeloyl-ACP methyl ester carboxylesterase